MTCSHQVNFYKLIIYSYAHRPVGTLDQQFSTSMICSHLAGRLINDVIAESHVWCLFIAEQAIMINF
jgi:hypothetical protein